MIENNFRVAVLGMGYVGRNSVKQLLLEYLDGDRVFSTNVKYM